MIGNYIAIALRNIFRSKFFSFINVIGLSVGMAASILILYFVIFENSYDRFHPNAESIYRVELDTYRSAQLESKSTLTPPAVAVSLHNNFPEVEEIARVASNPGKALFTLEQNSVKEARAYIADSSIFNVFKFEFLKGNPVNLLTGSHDLVISETLAKKLIGKDWSNTSLGKAIDIRSDGITGDFILRGVFRDFPKNSHFNPQALVPRSLLNEIIGPNASDESWTFNFFYSYIKVKPGSDLKSLQSKFNDHVARAREEYLKSVDASLNFRFHKLTDIHLASEAQFQLEDNGDARLVNALGITGMIILLVAWINFINLSTARAIRRAKEVGVRKVLGAAKRQLVFQFLMEAILLNGLALLVSLVVIRAGLYFFSDVIEVPVEFMSSSFLLSDPTYVVMALAIFSAGVLLSGMYPAFVLSSFSPVKALKSDVLKPKGITFRKSLIVVQTIISFVMIAGTFVVYKQLNFMQSRDLGIDINKVLVVEAPEVLDVANESAANVFKAEIDNLSFVDGFSMSSVVPGQEVTFRSYNLSNEKTKATINCGIIGIDADYFTNFAVPLISGKMFSQGDSFDSGVILNEEAIRQLGFLNVDEAIGAAISHDNKGQISKFIIQGVVKNYHHHSLHRSIEPIMFTNGRDLKYYSIKLNAGAWSAVENNVALIETSFERIFPGNAYNYFFLDQNFNDQYKAEMKFGTIFFGFSSLAIIISALGLLGLSTFIISLRNREVGIRKVMGASTVSITNLFMKDYLRLLLISLIIGVPVSYYLATYWLHNFAFKIEVGLLLFAIPVLLLSTIVIIVVGVQSVRAAGRNPVDVIGNR